MAQQGGNQNLPPSSLCRMGCGFYGNPMYDGMCSKCHKDALKRRQQTSSPTQMSGRVSPLATACSVASSEKSSADSVSQTLESSAASVETGSPTVTTTPAQDKTKVAAEKEQPETESTATLSSASSTNDDTPADQDRKPKKNRCHTCRKKVGLTGFACRCGGLFCGMHRYSDKHDCSFNYKELAQKEIRKSNPVVVAEKIQKI
ncbi:hypothetical protein LSH36_28g03013 [Paralvinella palmiformis]|uniref:Uncharacterized protein n=1 Tax=Paralvinella palmiformis TaxID=53620 RepID=A0AAD9KBH3_9ANNE|nr:hypothetical protein LSH36_28g03013 [Paralvinella palmiformis]